MRQRAARLIVAVTCITAGSAQTTPESPTFGTTVVIAGGLRGTVYSIPTDTMVLPDLTGDDVKRIGEVWTEALAVTPRHWRSGFPGLTARFEWFAIDYNGRFWIENAGRYTFALISDDGSRLFLDDIPIIDNDCQHSPDLRVAAVKLASGIHQIRVSYFQGPRDCLALVLALAGPDRRWRLFDASNFTPPSNPENWSAQTEAAQLVPTKPDEAALSIDQLFRRLKEGSSESRLSFKTDRSCRSQPIRICSK